MKNTISHLDAKIKSFKNDPEYMVAYLKDYIKDADEIERVTIMAIIAISERIKNEKLQHESH